MSDNLFHVIDLGVKSMRQSAVAAKAEIAALQAMVKRRDEDAPAMDNRLREYRDRDVRSTDILRRYDNLTLAVSLLIEELEQAAKDTKAPTARNALAKTAAKLTEIYKGHSA